MKIANIAELKNRLSEFLGYVERGEEVEVRKRNLPIARLVPLETRRPNETRLGCGRGTVQAKVELTQPLIPGRDWEMLR